MRHFTNLFTIVSGRIKAPHRLASHLWDVGLRLSARPSRNRACMTDASGGRADHPPPMRVARSRVSQFARFAPAAPACRTTFVPTRRSEAPPVDRHVRSARQIVLGDADSSGEGPARARARVDSWRSDPRKVLPHCGVRPSVDTTVTPLRHAAAVAVVATAAAARACTRT